MPNRNLIAASSNLPQVLYTGQVAAAEAPIYSGPPDSSVVVATATLCNTSGSARTVSLSVVKVGGTAGAANRVAIIELSPGESCTVDELVGLMLGPADSISGLASAATSVAIVLTGSVSS